MGLVPLVKLAQAAGLTKLAQDWLTVPTDKCANAGLKVTSLVAGMTAGADSIDDLAVLRDGGMGRVFTRAYAPSALGQFLRAFMDEEEKDWFPKVRDGLGRNQLQQLGQELIESRKNAPPAPAQPGALKKTIELSFPEHTTDERRAP